MKWKVSLSKKAEKQLKKLSKKLQSIVFLLREELQWYGPALEKWPNYGKLHGKKIWIEDIVTCKKEGLPMYVVVGR